MKNMLIAPLLAATLLGNAQSPLTVKKVTVFKNATALVVKEGNAPLKNGAATLPIPEQALYGAYFIGSGKDNAVKNIVFKNDTVKTKTDSRTVAEYVAGNLNKQVTINYTPTQSIDKAVSGKAVAYDAQSGMVKFVTDGGKTLVMDVSNIYEADFKDDPANTYMADSIMRMLVLKPEKDAANINLQEVYMTGGINWIPSYYLRLKDDRTARIEMKALVENFADDFKDADMELVVGAPQMKYSGTPDPMTYDYLTVSNQPYPKAEARNYMQSNAMVTFAAADGNGYFEGSFNTDGEKAGDIYIYKIGKVTLPNKSKGSYPIFAGNVEYKDKYEGTIEDITNFFTMRYVPQEDKDFDVFHSLELKNSSTVPFTTASVMVVNEKDQFVAQDELKYTPVGASSTVRLSKAVDIVMKNNEEEKNREDNAKKIGKTVYSKVTLKGTVNIDNYQDKEVTVTITKTVNGTITVSKDGAKVTKMNPYRAVNPSSEIKWEVKLGANDKKVLEYEYEVFFTP